MKQRIKVYPIDCILDMIIYIILFKIISMIKCLYNTIEKIHSKEIERKNQMI